MITRVEAWNYRCLRHIEQPLDRFRLLIGPNASGKSTFLSVLRFLRDMVAKDVPSAVEALCSSEQLAGMRELLWAGTGTEFQVAVEFATPRDLMPWAPDPLLRYEVAIEVPGDAPPRIASEALLAYEDGGALGRSRGDDAATLFPCPSWSPHGILQAELRPSQRGRSKVVAKTRASGNDYYHWTPGGKRSARPWNQSFSIGRARAALSVIPGDPEGGRDPHPAARWARHYLAERVFPVQLDVARMRRASPYAEKTGFALDGSNLAWAVHELRQSDERRFGAWLDHVRTALPDVDGLQVVVREDDRHAYLVVQYASGSVPAWLLSDGTLRMLALTFLAYRQSEPSLLLIEEPENGIHPRAIDAVHQALSGMWDHQVLLATHSPILLRLAEPKDILCFARDRSGETAVVAGESHPALREWHRSPALDDLSFAGVLG